MIEERIKNYWTQRAHDFGTVRRNELENQMADRWLAEIRRLLPEKKGLDILDVGTGTGFFAVLLAQEGHRVEGIDLTPAMLEEARQLAQERKLDIVFRQMDAQKLAYDDGCFDVVISRNLTWTLPDPENAYKEWFRVLRPDGVLLNFDANYGEHVRSESTQNAAVAADSPYGHVGVTETLAKENADITMSMAISREMRPAWDQKVLEQIGFRRCHVDIGTGARVLKELDLTTAPMFGICAGK
ncbi:MAG: class I SAM-dependent methyltransferase [Faecousia sp.]